MLNWQLLAERRILEAMERGDFDGLPGQGEPLRWRENPLVPPEWRLAFYLLERAGLAPDWIMRSAEIRADLAGLERQREQERQWMQERRAAMRAMSGTERAAEWARLREVQSAACEQLRERVLQINRKIADFNLVVPVVWLQYRLLDPADEEAALRLAWNRCDPEEAR